MNVKIKRAGGYDPKLGTKHPANQDPTLVTSTFKDNSLTRKIKMEGVDGGCVFVIENGSDDNVVEIHGGGGFIASVELDAERLWNLASGIISLFGGVALRADTARNDREALTDKVREVLCDNEARCLDDDVDREAVLRELVKALT